MRTMILGLALLLVVATPNATPTAAAQSKTEPSASTQKISGFKAGEARKIELHLRKVFGNQKIRVVPRPKQDASAEVYVADEFVGVVFLDDEDDDRSFQFQMAILEEDLE